jgi:hypothetical protein
LNSLELKDRTLPVAEAHELARICGALSDLVRVLSLHLEVRARRLEVLTQQRVGLGTILCSCLLVLLEAHADSLAAAIRP